MRRILGRLAVTAGIHCVPHTDYLSSCPADVVRIVFDQYGVLYPRGDRAPVPKPQVLGHNLAFSIRSFLANKGHQYDLEYERSLVRGEIDSKLKLVGAKSLTALIHGYNNSYEAASTNYGILKNRIRSMIADPTLFLEVYWDGLCRGPFTAPFPLWYWFDALTYSNFAGQVGLRPILRSIDAKVPLLVCTHSRGAGVALSAIVDPVFDPGVRALNPEVSEAPDMETRAAGVGLVCLAPAVGNGHPLIEMPMKLPVRSSLGIGFNALDPALGKGLGKHHPGVAVGFGDSSLGMNEATYRTAEKRINSASENWLYREVYENNPSHDLLRYVSHSDGRHFNRLIESACAMAGIALQQAMQRP
jgi:hypothetical protein